MGRLYVYSFWYFGTECVLLVLLGALVDLCELEMVVIGYCEQEVEVLEMVICGDISGLFDGVVLSSEASVCGKLALTELSVTVITVFSFKS